MRKVTTSLLCFPLGGRDPLLFRLLDQLIIADIITNFLLPLVIRTLSVNDAIELHLNKVIIR